jgi:cytochrome o ubiquinol oxidase operon protein cyoD
MSKTPTVIDHESAGEPTITAYVVGFALSLALTLGAYWLGVSQNLDRNLLVLLVSILAFCQFTVQMFCFLHLGSDRRPYWKIIAFVFMAGTVIIVVAGSLWIMANLNYHMLPADELKTYLHENEGL